MAEELHDINLNLVKHLKGMNAMCPFVPEKSTFYLPR